MAAVRFCGTTLVACVLAAVVPGQAAGQAGSAHIPLPADLTGTHAGVPYRILVPVDWNGTLLVYAHGTRLKNAGGPALPEAAPTPYPVASPTLEQQLLASGYALAGSEYENMAGVAATHALTEYFNGAVGQPSRVVVWGCSQGGGVTTVLREKYPNVYDGAIACAFPGSDPRVNDASLALGLAYDVTFGWPSEKWGPLEDVRDDLSFFADVAPILSPQIMNPANRAKWEFVRRVMKFPSQAFWMPDPQIGVPFFALAMWRATEQRANWETAFRGVVTQNLDHVYTLTDADKAYLASLGMTNADELLAQMNARTNMEADHAARVRAEVGSADGRLTRPLITLHSAYDGLARTEAEGLFRDEVQQAGSADALIQVYTALPGHCSFSAPQYLAVLGAMEQWLDTGAKPDPSAFPASLGFAPGYVPAPWPF